MALAELIAALAPGEATLLAETLASGVIKPEAARPLKLELQGLSPGLAAPLAACAAAGWRAAQLAEALILRAPPPRLVEVVSTQPAGASKLLAGTAYSLKSLLLQARTSVLIAGYSISQREILEPLLRLPGEALAIELFVNIPPPQDGPVEDVPAWARAWWRRWLADTWPVGLAAPTAWYAPTQVAPEADARYRKMHMKTVVVDARIWFVSSANFSYHGHHQNFELGAKVVDPAACAQVRAHFQAMCAAGVFERLD